MDEKFEARNEYIKFIFLLLFFIALTLGAAMLRSLIRDGQPATSPTESLEMLALLTPEGTATPDAIHPLEPTDLPFPIATPTATPTPAVSPQIYVVKYGDNLFRLGQQFGVTVDELMTANHLADQQRILVGQELVIPRPEEGPDSLTYTARWGDTLWSIARVFKVDMDTLATANKITDPNALKAGQELVIPDPD